MRGLSSWWSGRWSNLCFKASWCSFWWGPKIKATKRWFIWSSRKSRIRIFLLMTPGRLGITFKKCMSWRLLLNCTQLSSRKFSIQMYPIIELATSIKRSRSTSDHHTTSDTTASCSPTPISRTSTTSRPSCPKSPFPPTRDRKFCGNSAYSKVRTQTPRVIKAIAPHQCWNFFYELQDE